MITYTAGETYHFDLDKPVKERFAQLFPKYVPWIKKYADKWIEVSKPSEENLQKLEGIFDTYPDIELREYCEFLSVQCQIDRRIILYLQYMYDFGFDDSLPQGCTSILVNHDQPYIVRNLDWDYHEIIRSLTINAIYLKENKVVSHQLSIVPQILIPHTIVNFLWPHYTVQQQWNHLIENPQICSIQRLIYILSMSEMKYEDLAPFLEKQIVQHHGLLNIVGLKKDQCSIFYISDWSMSKKYPPQQEIGKNEKFLLSTNGDYYESSIKRYQAAHQRLQQIENLADPQPIVENVSMQYPNYNETTILVTVLEPFHKELLKVFIK